MREREEEKRETLSKLNEREKKRKEKR